MAEKSGNIVGFLNVDQDKFVYQYRKELMPCKGKKKKGRHRPKK